MLTLMLLESRQYLQDSDSRYLSQFPAFIAKATNQKCFIIISLFNLLLEVLLS